jgi:hypothetical protein
MATRISTPLGRFVQGDIFKGRTTNFQGRPLTTQKGEPRTDYYVAVAVPKRDAQPLLEILRGIAHADFPNGEHARRDFAWKYIDGDSQETDMRGTKPCDKEGFPGNIVFRFSSGFVPKLYDANYDEIIDPNRVKLGDYIRVSGTVRGNGDSMRPGLYLSHDLVMFVNEGEEIRTGIDPRQAFGAPSALSQPHLRMGESPQVQPRDLPPNPPSAGAPPPPPPPAGPQMAPGCPYTYEQLKGQGWSDEQMRAQGYLA